MTADLRLRQNNSSHCEVGVYYEPFSLLEFEPFNPWNIYKQVDEILAKVLPLKLLVSLANEQYFLVVLFIMLYKVFLTFESVDEILQCEHSNESC